MIKIKRIYEDYSKTDGYRILVDRLWPRGISKERAQIDLWAKDIAPSSDLRKWYSHDSDKRQEFQKKYLTELKDKSDSIKEDWVLSIFIVVISIPIALLWPFTLTYRLGREDQD